MSDTTPRDTPNAIDLCAVCAPKIRAAAGTAREVTLCAACSEAAERVTRLPRMPIKREATEAGEIPVPVGRAPAPLDGPAPLTVNEVNMKRAEAGLPPLAHVNDPSPAAREALALANEIQADLRRAYGLDVAERPPVAESDGLVTMSLTACDALRREEREKGAAEERARLVDLLREVEWQGGDVAGNAICPSCSADAWNLGDRGTHAPGCKLDAAIRGAR